jgi:hypothetical protein
MMRHDARNPEHEYNAKMVRHALLSWARRL